VNQNDSMCGIFKTNIGFLIPYVLSTHPMLLVADIKHIKKIRVSSLLHKRREL